MNSSMQNKTELGSPYCPNALVSRLVISKEQSYIVGITIAVIILPSLVINGVLFFVLTKAKKNNIACKMYIITSAVSGSLNSVTGFPMYIIIFTSYHHTRHCLFEKISIFTMQVNTHVLAYAILVLAIDRYFSVSPSFGWSKSAAKWMQSKNGSVIMCSSIVFMSILHGFVSVNFFAESKGVIGNVIMILINGIIACGVYVAYLKLYHEINVHRNSFKRAFNQETVQECKSRRIKKTPKYLREFIKTVAILLIAGILCYLPYIVMDCWTGWYTFVLKTEAPQAVRFAYYMSVVPVILYSLVNAALLLYRNDKVKQFVQEKLHSISSPKQRHNVECVSMRQHTGLNRVRRMTYLDSDESIASTPKSTPLLNRAVYVVQLHTKREYASNL